MQNFDHRVEKLLKKKNRTAARRTRSGATLENLENRRLLANVVVNSLAATPNYPLSVTVNGLNPGVTPVTLMDAINAANNTSGADVINITATGTLTLNSRLPVITEDLDIRGPGVLGLTIDAANAGNRPTIQFGNFNLIGSTPGVGRLSGFSLINSKGGAVKSTFETLTVADALIAGNSASFVTPTSTLDYFSPPIASGWN